MGYHTKSAEEKVIYIYDEYPEGETKNILFDIAFLVGKIEDQAGKIEPGLNNIHEIINYFYRKGFIQRNERKSLLKHFQKVAAQKNHT